MRINSSLTTWIVGSLMCLTFWLGLGMSATVAAQAPGLSYTPVRMAERMVELAEGPLPTRADLEKEFGFEFKIRSVDSGGTTYQSIGGYPFFNNPAVPSGSIYYDDFIDKTSFVFRFEDDQCCKPRPKYCISNLRFFRLLASRWQRHQIRRGPHNGVEVYYTATMGGVSRRLYASPTDWGGERCLDMFVIKFFKSVAPTTEGGEK